VPKALFEAAVTRPLEIVVLVSVLLPVRPRSPVPCLVSESAAIDPAKAEFELSAPIESDLPAAESVPAPEMAGSAWLEMPGASKATLPPALTASGPVPRAVAEAAVSVPAETTVPPEYELVPERVSVAPGDAKEKPPVPEMSPEIVRVGVRTRLVEPVVLKV